MDRSEYRLAAIMVTNIAGFGAVLQRDETGAIELLKEYGSLVSGAVERGGGRVIKTVGDTFLCDFPNTVDAVRSAVTVQELVGLRNETGSRIRLHVRIGVHLGDTHFLQNDAIGDGVSVAGRLQAIARPGRICVSGDVNNLVSSRLDLRVRSLGAVTLRGLSRTIDAYEISVAPAAEAEPADAPDEQSSEKPDAQPAGGTGSASGATGEARSGSALRSAITKNLESPEYADFNELKALVLQEIKRAGRRISIDDVRRRLPRRGESVDRTLETLADKGFLTRERRSAEDRPPHDRREGSRRSVRADERDDHSWGGRSRDGDRDEEERPEGAWDRTLLEPAPEGAYDPIVEDYKEHAAEAAAKEKAGFRAHLVSYLAVNGGLFLLWSAVMFGAFPWFLIVALAWGIGVASHYSTVRQKVRESRELDRSPGLTREQLRVYRRLVKARSSWKGHLVSNVATCVFLAGLNLITVPGFFWAAFPIGFMAIGLLSHLPAFKAKEKRLLKRLRDLGARIGTGQPGEASAARVGGPGSEAEQVKQRILAHLRSLPGSAPVGPDFEPVLDNYVEQIKLLDRKNSELDEIMRGVPATELERDLVGLEQRRSRTEDRKMLAEYDKSILQIRQQMSSFGELRNQRELLRLRLSSSMSQLKQMEIDLARMRSLSDDQETGSVRMLESKSRELSQYLEDLRDGYRELDRPPT